MAARVIAAINARDGAALFECLGPPLRQALPLARTDRFIANIFETRGRLTFLERADIPSRHVVYRVQAERGEWHMELGLNAEGLATFLYFDDPPAPPPPVPQSSPLRLPFQGEWTVVWGGDTEELNHHIHENNQRRAADLVITDELGRSHRGEGTSNEEYFAYGESILAVARGRVVTVIDGVPDNTPGSMNGYSALGNVVVVEHSANEFALYAHLQPGSIRVREGQRVRPGQVLGRCGNSGSSSEAHLHFHLQDNQVIQDGWGIEALFAGVRIRREVSETLDLETYTFLRGDKVSPAP